MKAHTMSIINSIILITASAWGYFSSDSPSLTALIPLFFGIALILCYPGVKNENKNSLSYRCTANITYFSCALHAPKWSYWKR